MNYQRSREQKLSPGSGKHSVYTYFSKDPNCDICLKTKITRASSRRRTGTVVPRVEHFCWFNNSRSQSSKWRKWIAEQTSICRSGTRFGNTVDTVTPVQINIFPGDPEEPNEVLGASKETKSHLHRQFPGIWQVLRGIILESLYVNTTHHQKQLGLLKEQCAE